MANDYITAADMEAERPDTTWDSTYDTLMGLIATAASRYIDSLCLKPASYFYADTAAARYFDGTSGTKLWVDHMAAAPSAVAVAEMGDVDGAAGTGGTYTTWATSDYYCWPMNAASIPEPYQALVIDAINGSKNTWYTYPRCVKITAQWGGYTAVPSDIKRITMAEAVRMLKKAQQSYRDTGGIIELGKLTYTKAIDPMTALVIAKYKTVSV